MQVLLRQDVENVGELGDVVDVAAGYARNYLLPRRLAVEVTKANLESLQRAREAKRQRQVMESGFTLAIPYDQLLLLVMALFMFVGATRGWYREFISTAVLISLTVFLLKPELAAPVVGYVAGFSRIALAFVRSGFSLDLGRLAESVDQVGEARAYRMEPPGVVRKSHPRREPRFVSSRPLIHRIMP